MSSFASIPLGYCVSEVRRKNLGGREQNLLSLSYGRIVRKDIDSVEGLLPESFDTYNVVEQGDTVLRLTDLQNDQRSLRVGFVEERGIITSAYVTVRPSTRVNERFLNYFLKMMDFRKDFYALGAGVRQSLKFEELRRVQVAVPDLAVQRAIADHLDTETARIDALIAKKQRMIGILREQFASAVEQAAPHGRYRDARLRWCTRRIADGTHGTYQRQTSGYPLLSAKNLRDGRVVVGDDESYVSESDYHEVSGTCGFQPGDVLFGVIGGSIGNVARLTADDTTAFQRSVAAVSPSELLHADFLYLISMGRSFQDKLKLAANSSAQSGVYLGALGDISIPLPSIADQALIVARLNRLLRWQDSLKASLSRQIELLLERRQALITAAVTGELEVPGVAA